MTPAGSDDPLGVANLQGVATIGPLIRTSPSGGKLPSPVLEWYIFEAI